jgi:hypothetical protein
VHVQWRLWIAISERMRAPAAVDTGADHRQRDEPLDFSRCAGDASGGEPPMSGRATCIVPSREGA